MEATLGIPGGVSDGFPPGAVLMFYGTTIPAGWALCDGTNGTPDLRDRFIVGAGKSYQPNATGGSNSVTLSTTQIPSHTHTITGGSHSHTVSGGSHSHTISGGSHTHSVNASGSSSLTIRTWPGGGTGTPMRPVSGIPHSDRDYYDVNTPISGLSVSLNSATPSMTCGSATPGSLSCGNASPSMSASNTGSGGSHENRPPYYALYFIMKL